LAELQARWFALLQSGRLELPSHEQMQESIAQWTRFRAHIFRAVWGRLDYLVDHTPFCDELATRIGCKPTWQAVRQEGLPFRLRFFAAPFVAAQYRLVGPHAKPWITREVITSLPIMHPLPDLINLYLRWTLSRVLHRVLGPEFAPKLELRER
jgi:dimethylaniline monooxygenase (N-oxide forming)